MPGTATFDVGQFIRGVKRPVRQLELCTDTDLRAQMDSAIGRLQDMPPADPEASLAGPDGDDAHAKLVEELQALNDLATETGAWTKFTLRAPTHAGRMQYVTALTRRDASEDAASSDAAADSFLQAEARMVADCLVEINGNAVKLTVADAQAILTDWPDDLTQELVTGINELGSGVATVPFSQRVSESLATPST